MEAALRVPLYVEMSGCSQPDGVLAILKPGEGTPPVSDPTAESWLLDYGSLEVFIEEPKPKRKKRTPSKGGANTVVDSGSRKGHANEDF
jgi:hypothetical protein